MAVKQSNINQSKSNINDKATAKQTNQAAAYLKDLKKITAEK